MIEKDGVIPNVLKKLLEKLKAALTDPNPELHEDHAKTRYAQMERRPPMTRRDSMSCVHMAVLALAIVAIVLSIFAATERRITITRATLTPDGTVYVTYRYTIGAEHQMRATAWSYGEWVSALRSKGWKVTEAWR